MSSLSVVMIVKNEALQLDGCLQLLELANEIVVIDGGSDDQSVDIARRYTEKVFIESEWQGYGVQRQRGQEHATGDWILAIDADERITPELREEILQVVQANDQTRAYAMPILPWCFGRFLRHGGWYPAPKVRLYPRKKAHYGPERVHEKLYYEAGVEIETLKGDLLHYTYRDMEHYLVKSAHYASEWANQRQQKGESSSLLQGIVHGAGCFIKMYIFKAGFLDGRQGLLMALLSAHSTFVKYADLWSRSRIGED